MKEIIHKAESACRCLKGIVHPTRIAILIALQKGPKSVTELEEEIGSVSQSNLSQHLSIMKHTDILSAERDGNKIMYSVTNKKIFDFLELAKEIFCK